MLQCCKPAAHRLERRTDRLGGDDAFNADRGCRLLAREQDLVQALAWPDAGKGDVDVSAGLEPGESDHPLGKVDDLHRLTHVEDVDRNARMPCPKGVACGSDDEVASLPDGHEVADHVRVRHRERPASLHLSLEFWHYRAVR